MAPLYDRLETEHRFKDMGKECIPILLQRFADVPGSTWTRPRIMLDLVGISNDIQADVEIAGFPRGLISEYILGETAVRGNRYPTHPLCNHWFVERAR